MTTYDAIIIGAGHNGLIAAAYVARAGARTLVLERRDVVGGACVTEEVWPGYRVSTAAYLCSPLLPEIIEDLGLRSYGLDIYPRETAGFAPYADGTHLFLYADAERTRRALEEFCRDTPQDVEAFFQFERDVERAAAVVDRWLLAEPPTQQRLRADFAAHGIAQLFDDLVTSSVRSLLDRRFRSDRLKAVLATDGLIGTYGGPSTPGTAYVLLHHYLGMALGRRGAWGYVRGGMGQITQALAQSARDRGAEIRTGCAVDGIEAAESGFAVTARGEQYLCKALLSNADPWTTFERLAPWAGSYCTTDGAPPQWRRLMERGGASAKINLAVSELPRFTCLGAGAATPDPRPEHLGTVHLCEGVEQLARAWREAEQGVPSTEPMVEMYVQTATDSSLTPPGRHILSLFVQYFPYNLAAGLDLDTERERFADRVIAIAARHAPNIPGSILHRQVLTPRDLEARFGLTGGHIFHGDLLPPNLWADRPAPGFRGARTPVGGLYLCGAGAHPGGCVFGAPGYNAARAVVEDLSDLARRSP